MSQFCHESIFVPVNVDDHWAARMKPGWNHTDENSCRARGDEKWQIRQDLFKVNSNGARVPYVESIKQLTQHEQNERLSQIFSMKL